MTPSWHLSGPELQPCGPVKLMQASQSHQDFYLENERLFPPISNILAILLNVMRRRCFVKSHLLASPSELSPSIPTLPGMQNCYKILPSKIEHLQRKLECQIHVYLDLIGSNWNLICPLKRLPSKSLSKQSSPGEGSVCWKVKLWTGVQLCSSLQMELSSL